MARFGHIQRVIMLLLISALPVVPVLTRVRHPVPVLWMMPVSSGSGRENLSAGLVPAVRMALQDLQKQPEPLGNYEIQLQLLDSQCDPAEALRVLFDTMWAGPRYLLMIGGACPPVATLIARALPALSLVQVSFVAPPPSLSNKKWSKNLFSTVPSVRTLNQAVVKLLQRYKWRRVGVISGDGPRLAEMKKDLTRQLLKADVQLAVTKTFSEDACSRLKELKDQDVRIIIGQFEEDSASKVFCCVSDTFTSFCFQRDDYKYPQKPKRVQIKPEQNFYKH